LGVLGFLACLGGVAAMMYYWLFFDTTVIAGGLAVNNIGLMQDRQSGIIVGVAFAVIGLACVALAQYGVKRKG
jgi:hypothetical protein